MTLNQVKLLEKKEFKYYFTKRTIVCGILNQIQEIHCLFLHYEPILLNFDSQNQSSDYEKQHQQVCSQRIRFIRHSCNLLINSMIDYPTELSPLLTQTHFETISSLWVSIDHDFKTIGNIGVSNDEQFDLLLESVLELVGVIFEKRCGYKHLEILSLDSRVLEVLLENACQVRNERIQEVLLDIFFAFLRHGEEMKLKERVGVNLVCKLFSNEGLNQKLLDYYEDIQEIRTQNLDLKVQELIDQFFEFD